MKKIHNQFSEFINKRHRIMLQELLDVNAGNYNRKAWLKSVAGHYNTLQMVGVEAEIPDEIMAELILERLV
jgi:hypothetical protein